MSATPNPIALYRRERAKKAKRDAAVIEALRPAYEALIVSTAPRRRGERGAGLDVQGARALRHPVATHMPTPRMPTPRATLTCKTCAAPLRSKRSGRRPEYCESCRRQRDREQNRESHNRHQRQYIAKTRGAAVVLRMTSSAPRPCAHCGAVLVRKQRPSGGMEAAEAFGRRKFCGRACQRAAQDAVDRVVCERYVAGESMRSVGATIGVTRQRVLQILTRHGVPTRGVPRIAAGRAAA